MPKPPNSAEISAAAKAGAEAEYGGTIEVKAISLGGGEFSPMVKEFLDVLDPLLDLAGDRLGSQMMISVTLSAAIARLRLELSAEAAAFVLRSFADSQMSHDYNELGDGSNGR
jgi:hypothetical protein